MSKLPPPTIHPPRGQLPVLLSVPHSGRDYPDWLVGLAAAGKPSLTTLEDPFVDRLVWRALQRGCGAVIARTPRAAVDCNRGEDEVDPSVIDGARRTASAPARAAGSASFRRAPRSMAICGGGAITPKQLDERLNQAHRPYHEAIEAQLALLLDRFGCALLLDCHSMPPPPTGVPPIVFGDCRGRTADAWISAEAVGRSRSGWASRPGSTTRSPAAM